MSTVESEVRDYLRGRPELMGLLNGDVRRINMDWQGDMRATHVTLYRAGGPLHDYLPLENPLIILHVFGSTRPAAAEVAEKVNLALHDLDCRAKPLMSSQILSMLYVPTTDGVSRYVITTVVTRNMGLAA